MIKSLSKTFQLLILAVFFVVVAGCTQGPSRGLDVHESHTLQVQENLSSDELGVEESAAVVFCKSCQGLDLQATLEAVRALDLPRKRYRSVAKTLGHQDVDAFVAAFDESPDDSSELSQRLEALGIRALDLQRAVGYVLIFEEYTGQDVAQGLLDQGVLDAQTMRTRLSQAFERDQVSLPSSIEMKGELEIRDGVDVLTLHGSPQERGYSHGRLIGDKIAKVVRHMSTDIVYLMSAQKTYEQIRALQYTSFDFTRDQLQELAGMLRGIQEVVASEDLLMVDRPMDIADLQAFNTVSDWIRFGCSSFTLFGSLAERTGPVVVRNLDYIVDSGSMSSAYPTVIAHIPDDTSLRPWVSATWPGLVGLYSGMNDQGAVLLLHDSNGSGERRIGLVPRSYAARDVIESMEAGPEAIDLGAEVFRARPTYIGCNFHCVVPDGKGGVQAAIYEYDGTLSREQGVTVRRSGANDEAGEYLITTNHYCLREGSRKEYFSSSKRYDAIEKELAGRDSPVNSGELMPLIRSVEMDYPVVRTLHTVLAYPLKQRFDVAFADKERTAPHKKPLSFDLETTLVRE